MQAIKCIYRENVFASNSLSRSELIGETAGGTRRPLLQKLKGYNAILTVTPEGFKLESGKGEILRRGKEKYVFRIYDSMLFDPGNLLVRDEIKGVELPFKEYEGKFGFDRTGVLREVSSKFYLYTETTKGETAFGIVNYFGSETLAIHSLYIPEPMTDTEKAHFAARFIYEKLDANQYANVSAVGLPQYLKVPDVRIYGHEYKPKFEQAYALFGDSLERRESITEVFDDDGINYNEEVKEDVTERTATAS